MNPIYSYIFDILLIVAFIIDRIFRLKSLKEYKEAKEAQIANVKQQLENERKNNDIEITGMHKKRYESLKVILEDKQKELDIKEDKLQQNIAALLDLKSDLENANRKAEASKKLLEELNRVELEKNELEIEKKVLIAKIEKVKKVNLSKFAMSRSEVARMDAVINNLLT